MKKIYQLAAVALLFCFVGSDQAKAETVELKCASDYRQVYCHTGGEIMWASVKKVISGSCQRGVDWGVWGMHIWVDFKCAAVFKARISPVRGPECQGCQKLMPSIDD